MDEALPQIEIRPGLRLPRLIRGTWQVHERADRIDEAAVMAEWLAGFDLGFTAIEASDSYAGVEELLGRFRTHLANHRGREAAASLRVHTRVSQSGALVLMPDAIIQSVRRSCQRLGQARLDLVQLQWWNLDLPGWGQAAETLAKLKAEGLIAEIGLTNFPADEMRLLLKAGLPLISNQVQISLLDPRAQNGLVAACREAGMALFGYGPLAGGFLSEAWLGLSDPGLEPSAAKPFGKVYRQLIERFGGWDWLQQLLRALKSCATRHETDIASIALAWSLAQSGASALLVGMSSAARAAAYAKAARLVLTHDDKAAIMAALSLRGPIEGEIADIERREMQAAIRESYKPD